MSLRVPAGAPASRHVEHRASGADANPYLVAATVLAGAYEGLVGKLDPGPPVTQNGYESGIAVTLPRDWRSAIAAAEPSSFLREALGAAFLHSFIAIKSQEWEKFNALIPAIDYDWYLDNV